MRRVGLGPSVLMRNCCCRRCCMCSRWRSSCTCWAEATADCEVGRDGGRSLSATPRGAWAGSAPLASSPSSAASSARETIEGAFDHGPSMLGTGGGGTGGAGGAGGAAAAILRPGVSSSSSPSTSWVITAARGDKRPPPPPPFPPPPPPRALPEPLPLPPPLVLGRDVPSSRMPPRGGAGTVRGRVEFAPAPAPPPPAGGESASGRRSLGDGPSGRRSYLGSGARLPGKARGDEWQPAMSCGDASPLAEGGLNHVSLSGGGSSTGGSAHGNSAMTVAGAGGRRTMPALCRRSPISRGDAGPERSTASTRSRS